MMQVDNKVKMFSIEENIWQGLTLTDSAVRQIHYLLECNPDMLGLRLSVQKYGCAGLGYVVGKVTQVEDSDRVYEHDGARLYVPLNAMPFIDGTELDYVEEGLNSVFKFNNPKTKRACGCGRSFGL